MIEPFSGGAAGLIEVLAARSWKLAVAESCTAGLVADLLARIPGASGVFWGSFVCYTEGAKEAMLGIPGSLVACHGAVSRETALAMVRGALEKSGADMAAAVTGLAGPGGDGSPVPVGTVWIATALRGGETLARCFRLQGSRDEVRSQAAAGVVEELFSRLFPEKIPAEVEPAQAL
jgi:PncC family amidohydrolase